MSCKYSFLRAVRSVGKPSTEPMRSAIALRDLVRRRLRGARSSLSRTTSDFEILRPRDSASMSATKGSGNRTVRVFMASVYYISDSSARQAAEPASLLTTIRPLALRRYSEQLHLGKRAANLARSSVTSERSVDLFP